MSHRKPRTLADLRLRDRVSIRNYGDREWFTGNVIELALLGDDMSTIRVTLELDDETSHTFDGPLHRRVWEPVEDEETP